MFSAPAPYQRNPTQPTPNLKRTSIDPLFGLIIHSIFFEHQPLALYAQLSRFLPIPTLISRLRTGETRMSLVPQFTGLRAEGSVMGVGLVDLVLVL